MIKRLANHIWDSRDQVLRYMATGGSAFVFDIVTLYLFKEYFQWRPFVAIIVNQVIIFIYIFLLNKHWSFKAGGETHEQLVRFFILAASNYLFAILWMWLFTEHWPVHVFGPSQDYLLVHMVNVALSVGWNFLLYKHWVYRNDEKKIATHLPPNL